MSELQIPHALLRQVLEPIGLRRIDSVPAGMSGASVYRCLLSTGEELALKRWPDGTLKTRIEEIHRVLQCARTNGCSEVPELVEVAAGPGRCRTVWTEQGGRNWDLTQWMRGDAAAADATLTQIQTGAATIAKFHRNVRSIGGRHQTPPAVLSRLERFQQLDSLLREKRELFRPCESMPVEVRDASELVRSKWDTSGAQIAQSLNRYLDREVPVQFVLRDVHRDHVLFCGQQVSGLIDFDAIRLDTPAADLARWVGSFLVDRPDPDLAWEAGLAGFQNENALISGWQTEIDPMMAKDLCFATTWISLVNWLVWVLLEKRTFPAGPQAMLSRLGELTRLAAQTTSFGVPGNLGQWRKH